MLEPLFNKVALKLFIKRDSSTIISVWILQNKSSFCYKTLVAAFDLTLIFTLEFITFSLSTMSEARVSIITNLQLQINRYKKENETISSTDTLISSLISFAFLSSCYLFTYFLIDYAGGWPIKKFSPCRHHILTIFCL